MNQIYNFEQNEPPIVNENMLRARLEKKKAVRNAAIVAVASVMLQMMTLLLGILMYSQYPIITFLCVSYVVVSMVSSSVISIVYSKKGECV